MITLPRAANPTQPEFSRRSCLGAMLGSAIGGGALAVAGEHWLRGRSSGTDFREAFAKARPSIVAIHSMGDPSDGVRRARYGAGFAFDNGRLIATNAHVVRGAKHLSLHLYGGRIVEAEEIGFDSQSDLALLRLPHDVTLPPLTTAQAPPVPGSPVLAIGTPFGYEASASAGIVSGLGRAYDSVDPTDFIQHDAAINPGSSGGPLLDGLARVIGINTATPDAGMVDFGVGLAIPIWTALPFLRAIAARGHVARPWMGVSVQMFSIELAEALGTRPDSGLIVVDVAPNSPAEAVLRHGDILLSVAGRPMALVRDLPRAIAGHAPGTRIPVRVRRNEAVLEATIPLVNTPEQEHSTNLPLLGRRQGGGELQEPDASQGFGLSFLEEGASRSRGKRQIAVASATGIAALQGIGVGDAVLAIGTVIPDSAAEAAEALEKAATMNGTAALLMRRGTERPHYVVLFFRLDKHQRVGNISTPSGGPY
jgi:serine protease Do